MSVDGIGRSGPPPAADAVGALEAGQVAEVAEAGAAGATEATAGSAALAQLGRGEISLPQYLDLTVQQAVEHLQGRLSPEQLGFVRTELRAQVERDPALVELVRRTTGQHPAANED